MKKIIILISILVFLMVGITFAAEGVEFTATPGFTNFYFRVFRQSDGFVWDTVGSNFESFVDAQVANYDIVLTEQGTSGYYTGVLTGIDAAHLTAIAYNNATPAITDVPIGASDSIAWDSSVVQKIIDTDGQVDSENSGDAFTIVDHADYGNDQLVRSTTSANTLNVNASGEADVNVIRWLDATVPTPVTAGVPRVEVTRMDTDVITSVSIQNEAFTSAKFPDAFLTDAKVADDIKVDVNTFKTNSQSVTNVVEMFDGDGTPLLDNDAPFTQSQGAGLAGGFSIATITTGSTVTEGTETLTHVATQSHNDVYYEVADDTDGPSGIDYYLEFNTGGHMNFAVEFHMHGRYEENGAPFTNTVLVQAYNFNIAAFQTITTLTNSASDISLDLLLTNINTGQNGGDEGDVRIRFLQSTQETGSIVFIDHAVIGYVGGGLTLADISEAVWIKDVSEITTADTSGKLLNDIEEDTSTTLPALIISENSDTQTDIAALNDFDSTSDPVEILTNGGSAGKNAEELVDDFWDEDISKAEHNVANSAAKKLRESDISITADTAQGPGTGNNQIQLATGASDVDGAYDPARVFIKDGTGAGQSRNILQYNGSSRTATVDRNWKVNPTNDSEYIILSDAGREHVNEGLAQQGSSTVIRLNTLASSANNTYKNQYVFIRSGLGQDQVRRVVSYNGTTKDATVSEPWNVSPDSTSGYVIIPFACVEVQAIGGQELSSNTGENFDTFFDASGATTSTEVDDVDDIPNTSELGARTLPTADYFLFGSDTVANVTNVATTANNSDMRGTNSALLAGDINLSAGVVESNLLQMNGVTTPVDNLVTFTTSMLDLVNNWVLCNIKALDGDAIQQTDGKVHSIPVGL